jgi:hypothetical protein
MPSQRPSLSLSMPLRQVGEPNGPSWKGMGSSGARWHPVVPARRTRQDDDDDNKQNNQLVDTLPTSGVAHAQDLLAAIIDERSTLQ